MANNKAELEAYPKYKQLYLLAFDRMIEARKSNDLPVPPHWETPEKVMSWWLQEASKELTDTEITKLLG